MDPFEEIMAVIEKGKRSRSQKAKRKKKRRREAKAGQSRAKTPERGPRESVDKGRGHMGLKFEKPLDSKKALKRTLQIRVETPFEREAKRKRKAECAKPRPPKRKEPTPRVLPRKSKKPKLQNASKKLRRMKKYYKKWSKMENKTGEFMDYFEKLMYEKRQRMHERKRKKYEEKLRIKREKEDPPELESSSSPEQRRPAMRKPDRPDIHPSRVLEKRPSESFEVQRIRGYSPLEPRKKKKVPETEDLKKLIDAKFKRRMQGLGGSESESEGFGLEDLEQENLVSRRIGEREELEDLERERRFKKKRIK